jgi:pimeloyl-ACP methyl ester carboxylesterase
MSVSYNPKNMPIPNMNQDGRSSMDAVPSYVPRIESRSRGYPIRGLKIHVRSWRTPGRPSSPLIMLHGWMDCSASFQFMVDKLRRGWTVYAPDWRGFGLSARSGADGYWFPDYLADLDRLLDRLSPDRPVDLVAHSMGGNVAMLYAGVRPERVRRLVNLEGMGLAAGRASAAPDRYRHWLDEIATEAPGAVRTYPTIQAVAERLQRANPRLTTDRALFVAAHWTRQRPDGGFEMLGDPVHKRVNPVLYRLPEVLACWRKIRADVLWVMAAEQPAGRWYSSGDELERRLRVIKSVNRATVHEAGHMLHHDQPDVLADLVEEFLK